CHVLSPRRPESYPLSLHDALPISQQVAEQEDYRQALAKHYLDGIRRGAGNHGNVEGNPRYKMAGIVVSQVTFNVTMVTGAATDRSEEHTSELQSRENLVCRLLLEK